MRLQMNGMVRNVMVFIAVLAMNIFSGAVANPGVTTAIPTAFP